MIHKFGFKILDINGEAIPLNKLDEEVCDLFNIPINKKHYCLLGSRNDYPEGSKGDLDFKFNTYNWFDTIGWLIADKNYSFEEIINHYKNEMKDFLGQIDEDGEIITIEKIYPYHIKLLNYWINKGYKTLQIEIL